MKKLRIIDSVEQIDIDRWNSFVRNHPKGNIFQSNQFYRLYSKTKGYVPLALFIVNDKDEIVGLQLSVTIKLFNNFLDKISSRSIIFGGPLILEDDKSILDFLLKEYTRRIEGKAILSQYRNMWDTSAMKGVFSENSFFLDDHLDILIDLSQGEERIWQGMKRVCRKNIRKGYKSNVTSDRIDLKVEENLKNVYDLIKVVYKRIKLPLHPYSFFKNSVDILGDNLVCIGLFHENQMIGARIALGYNKLLYDWYAGADNEKLNLRPNDVLPWEVMRFGVENSYDTFDFGGAGKPNVPYGVRDHKLKFGGELVNFGRYERIHSPLIYKMAVSAIELKKKIFNKQ